MTPKQALFVREYLVDMNGTQAAIRAGYNARSAGQQAGAMLKKPDIAAMLGEGQAARAERLEITADRIAQEYARIAFANMADYMRVGPDGVTIKEVAELTANSLSRAVKRYQEHCCNLLL